MSRSVFKLILLVLLLPVICLSQENDICADCHTDSGGDPVEVSTASLMGSAHEDFDCVDCHYLEDPEDHAEDLDDVDCGECHDEVSEQYTIHGRAVVGESAYAPQCKDCHGTHRILPPR
ncbi:hypothetical protein HOD41_00760, partial [bacterium]|nr:hypothetical protein [bacterium]